MEDDMHQISTLESRRLLSTTPSLTTSFESFSTAQTTAAPPADCYAAVGPNEVITIVNRNVAFYTKNGVSRYTATLKEFFGLQPTDPDVFADPRVMFDQYRAQFVVSALSRKDAGGVWRAGVWVAVSNDSDPSDISNIAGTWEVHFFDASSTTNNGQTVRAFPDFPMIAAGVDALYISAVMSLPGTETTLRESRVWILDKNPLYDQDPSTRVPSNVATYNPLTAPDVPTDVDVALFPAQTFGNPVPTVGTYFFSYGAVNEGNGDGPDVEYVLDVRNPLQNPAFTWHTVILGADRITARIPPPPSNPPRSSNVGLGDGRVRSQPVWRDGYLWAVHTAPLYTASTETELGQESVYWVKVNTTTMTVAEQGFIGGEEIAPETRTGFGAIAVNAAGDAAIGFTAIGPGIYAGAYYAFKRAGETTFAPPKELAVGEGYYAYSRWGDYSAMVVDPSDDHRFWMYNMYAASAAGDNSYKSRVGTFTSAPSVLGRHVFYNNSTWDGFDPTNSVFDDGAVADKVALLPGQTATFANYTSYSKGINGVMVEMDGLEDGVTLTSSDFEFRAGNDANPAGWPVAPNPSSIRIRRVPGVWGKRVAMVWPDYDMDNPGDPASAVANKWLKVTVKANANTGLSSPDVFYFGNLIGDTGINNAGGYATLAEDYSATKQHAPSVAPINSFFDHNRDGVVDSVDYDGIVKKNFFATLILLSAPV